MFHGNEMQELCRKHYKLLENLAWIEDDLNKRFFGANKAVRAIILAVATGEPLLFVGAPGVAKSMLIRTFCQMTGLLPIEGTNRSAAIEQSSEYFEYLLTPFTEPGELFGFWDLEKLHNENILQRANEGRMMQHARVVYLDEVFNGSGAILNSILSFLNERLFHDNNRVIRVGMENLFGATNQVPESDDLRAVYDRFVLRCAMHNVKANAKALRDLLSVGWKTTFARKIQRVPRVERFWDSLNAFRESLSELTLVDESPVYEVLAAVIATVRRFDLSDVSNRRLIKFVRVMAAHRIYEGCRTNEERRQFEEAPIRPVELDLLADYFLDVVDDPETEQTINQLRSLTGSDEWARGLQP